MTPETGNKQKLESFFKEEYNTLKGYVGSRLKASASRDPEDIIQDVAYNLFASADGYGPISNVAAFVYRSIKNKIIDTMRKGGRLSEERLPSSDDPDQWMEFAELFYGNETSAYSEKMVSSLKEAMLGLNPADHDILMAVDFEGYSYKEISEETGKPEGTLMSRRHRALGKLNKLLIEIKNKEN
ncbi:MAG: RNA polymerase sigma factor [Flavobacteriales bacterium]|nr:RNA polymerase sigma factor [Flavobacteriales bacterium]